jgi:uncharacterized protein YpbB
MNGRTHPIARANITQSNNERHVPTTHEVLSGKKQETTVCSCSLQLRASNSKVVPWISAAGTFKEMGQ